MLKGTKKQVRPAKLLSVVDDIQASHETAEEQKSRQMQKSKARLLNSLEL